MFANEVIGFINDSPTPFHAVSNIKKILDDNGLLKYMRADVKKSDLVKNIMLRGTALQ